MGNEDETGVDKKLNLVGSSLTCGLRCCLKALKDAPAKPVKAQNLLRAKVFLMEVGNKDLETEKEWCGWYIEVYCRGFVYARGGVYGPPSEGV